MRPGKDAHTDQIDARFPHVFHIPLQHIGSVQPLLGIVIATVNQAILEGIH
jgi:hypothetical protein